MKYKDKILRKRLLTQLLFELVNFAYSDPKLSLEERRKIVAAIRSGGSSSKKLNPNLIQTYFHSNYQKTQKGILRSCLDKIITYSDEQQKLKKAICVVCSLSAWARSNPQLSGDIFDDFISRIVPEDKNISTFSGELISEKRLKENLGSQVIQDLITIPGNVFYKKYRGK